MKALAVIILLLCMLAELTIILATVLRCPICGRWHTGGICKTNKQDRNT